MNIQLVLLMTLATVSLLSLGCGELSTTMAPSVTTVDCPAQTNGSLVNILDDKDKAGC